MRASYRCLFQKNLSSQAKGFDNRSVTLNIVAFNIIEQPATFTNEHQQSTTRVVIFLMHLQMLGQICNPMGKKSNLDFRGSGIGIMLFVSINQFFFGFCCISQRLVLLKIVITLTFKKHNNNYRYPWSLIVPTRQLCSRCDRLL